MGGVAAGPNPPRVGGSAPGAAPVTRPGPAIIPVPGPVRTAGVVPGVAAARGIPITALGSESLQTWWSWNRRSFLSPRTWVPETSDPTRTVSDAMERARSKAIPLLRQGLRNHDTRVRAAAALALGRIAGADAVSELERLLSDPSLWVRQTAILSLGATASPAAVYKLLRIAHGTDDHGAFSRPLALLSLGIATRANGATSSAPLVERILINASPGEKETLGTAAMLFAKLSDSTDLHAALRKLMGNESETVLLRARAAENLVGAEDRESIAGLTRAVSARHLDLRRSAALALGQAEHDLALPALLTAFETEKELLTRGFALVAIGRHGGADAASFLIEQIRSGRKPLRVWAGVGLGLLSRSEPQPNALAAIRFGWKNEHNHDLRGMWLVAMGLARDAEAIDLMAGALRESQSSLVRAGAVEGLALSGDTRALPMLRKALTSDSCPFVRSVSADALAHVGDTADAELLAKALRNANDPDLRLRLATAIGALGAEEAWRALHELHAQTDNEPGVRAAVLQSLGTLLSRNPERSMPALASMANYTLFPSWLAWALTHEL